MPEKLVSSEAFQFGTPQEQAISQSMTQATPQGIGPSEAMTQAAPKASKKKSNVPISELEELAARQQRSINLSLENDKNMILSYESAVQVATSGPLHGCKGRYRYKNIGY